MTVSQITSVEDEIATLPHRPVEQDDSKGEVEMLDDELKAGASVDGSDDDGTVRESEVVKEIDESAVIAFGEDK